MLAARVFIEEKPVSLGQVVIDANTLLEWFEEYVRLAELLLWLNIIRRYHLLTDKGDVLLHNCGIVRLRKYDR